jgi:hypothetical protein
MHILQFLAGRVFQGYSEKDFGGKKDSALYQSY